MNMKGTKILAILASTGLFFGCTTRGDQIESLDGNDFEIVKYNNPAAVSDLGVGLWAWPIPIDYDGDGDMDLLVSCPDKPFNGLYFFENTSGADFPVFAPPVRLMESIKDIQISYVGDMPRVLIPGAELKNFSQSLNKEK